MASSRKTPSLDIPGNAIRLEWSKYGFEKFEMYRHTTLGGGHCLLHAICNAFYIPYRTGYYEGRPLDRHAWIRKLRREIADTLGKIDPDTGDTYYNSISGGEFRDLGLVYPEEFSQENLYKYFVSDKDLGDEMYSVFSYILKESIYILDLASQDVFLFGGMPNPNYASVVAIYVGGHFEMVSIKSPITGKHITHFEPSHSFIKFLRDRMALFKKE